jgi:DNA-binding XRE family transcriptional regulator
MPTEFIDTPVRRARGNLRLGQVEAANRASVSQSYWGSVERGESVPTLPVARRIAATLGMTVDELWPPEPKTKSVRRRRAA